MNPAIKLGSLKDKLLEKDKREPIKIAKPKKVKRSVKLGKSKRK